MAEFTGRNIAVFCDGTWNNRDRTEHDTSVARLEEVVAGAQNQSGRVAQRTWYEAGVGATDGLTGAAAWLDKLRGGALGRGLTQNIRDCYQFLVDNYQSGDRLFIFGFSRGAYTARSLAGLIRAAGIPGDAADIDRAMAWYRDRNARTHPGSEASHRLRAEISPHLYTSDAEASWRAEQGRPVGDRLAVDYLGVFDTVGTLGIPGVLGQFRRVPGGHGFHDHQLSRSVLSGRHAVAVDETRIFYRPTLWDNLERLNDGVQGAQAPYQQLWFPGDHGKLGGSGAERALSNAALAWIVEGAVRAGLQIDLPESLRPEPDAFLGPLHNGSGGVDPSGWLKWARRGPGAQELAQLHATTKARLLVRGDYRPGALRHLLLDQSSLVALRREAEARVA